MQCLESSQYFFSQSTNETCVVVKQANPLDQITAVYSTLETFTKFSREIIFDLKYIFLARPVGWCFFFI